jgi:radical SAM superfamily enzyme YgiQ (UPF0313 family)
VRVLLISTNRCRVTVPPFPLGLAYVLANLDAGRHEVGVWDAMFHDHWDWSLRQRLREFRPQAIGLSVRNVDDQDIRRPHWFLEEVKQIVAVCREESDATLIAGGSGFSMFAGEALAYLGVDFGIIGEGERALGLLLQRLEAGTDPGCLPGLVWQENGKTRTAAPQWIEDLDEVAFPDRAELDALRYHETQGEGSIPNTATVQTKRGCTQWCTYCATPAMEGSTLRLRSPQAVVTEIEGLVRRGITRLQFVDALFTNPASHAEAICRELLRRGLRVRWSCTINPAFADPDLLRLMKQAGCALAIVGNESGCTRMLRQMGKGFAQQDVQRCFSLLQAEGIRYNAFLLLGGPGEDRASVQESVELMEHFAPAQVSVTVGVRIYPHCSLARLAEEEGAVAATASLLRPRFYLAPAVGDWIWDYLTPIMDRNPHWTY